MQDITLPINIPFNILENAFGTISIMLIGSYTNKTYVPDSDIDIIVVSDYFKGLSQYIRRRIVNSYFHSKVKIDAVCMTKDEFNYYKRSDIYIKEKPILLYGAEL